MSLENTVRVLWDILLIDPFLMFLKAATQPGNETRDIRTRGMMNRVRKIRPL